VTTSPAPASFAKAPEERRFESLEDAGAPKQPASKQSDPRSIPLDIHAQRNRQRRGGIPLLWPAWQTLRQLGYASIFYGIRLRGQFPSRLLASPSDIWPGDPAIGALMPQGLFRHQGLETSGDVPDFTDPDLPLALKKWLHSFAWLRDLATLDDVRKARAIAEPALKEWLLHYSRWDKISWAPDVLGQRLISLINHAPLVLASKDLVYRSTVLNTLAHQGRHLARTLDMAGPGLPRARAATGLVFSSILLPGGEGRMKPGLKVLERTLEQYLLPDGTPESRNPEDLLETLQLLITLRDGYRAARKTPPTFLQVYIDKAAAALRGLQLRGHGVAAFNGARHGQHRAVQHCLDMSESQANAQLCARQGGYQRLEAGETDIVMDTGLAPIGRLSKKAHAGALAFELAHDGAAVIVNCGAASTGEDCGVPAEALRASAAHSTFVINDTNMARVKQNGEIGRTGKTLVCGRDSDSAGHHVRAQSDVYAQRHGYRIERCLTLSMDGLCVRGCDQVETVSGKAPRASKVRQLDLRFHLHPDVEVTCTATGDGALLRLPNGVWWRFRAEGASLAIEPSVYVTRQSARAVPTQQIVITAALESAKHTIHWTLQHGQSTP
jgi:uncharacterized heparinase superfamily protein